jgi:2-polyprenyl-3-methyl-5-hydroxy-6-metoxy-1,4-benzoquinol methylase
MTCPVCHGTDVEPFAQAKDIEYCTSADRFSYARCRACATVFLERPPIERLREIYPPNYYSYRASDRPSLVERLKQRLDGRLFRRLLADLPGDELAVLDVGGGTGWLLSLARAQDPRVRATHELDIDESARAGAEAAGHVFHCQRAEEFVPPRRFDLVILLNLIEHVSDPERVLSTLAGALSDRGVMLLKTPNTDTLDCRLFRHRSWGGFHCPRHWVLFTRDTLAALARRCGLEPVWIRYTQGAPQWAPSLLGWLADHGMATVTADRPMYRHPLYAPLLAATAAFDYARLPFAPTAQMFALFRRGGSGSAP